MNRLTYLLALLVLCVAAGCSTLPGEREMNSLASALTKVAAAVDATARYNRSADDLTQARLLQASTAHDPGLLKPFEGMTLQVLRSGRDTAVLLCQAGGGMALLEDAGCTARLDVHRWNSGSERCEFTLDVKQVCSR
jgi:hypothetical protein